MAEKGYTNLREVQQQSAEYFKHYFIPHEGNNHQPKILHHHWLRFFTIAVLFVKVAATAVLFVSYPSTAQFAAISSGQIIELTNGERVKQGAAALTQNAKLTQAAQAKANDILAKGYFSHDSPDGKQPWDWIIGAGYRYTHAGENLAKDFTSAGSTVTALMNSASHRKNILNTNYTEIGVAVVDGILDGKQTVVMVQMFGTQQAQVAVVKEPAKPVEVPAKPVETKPIPPAVIPAQNQPVAPVPVPGRYAGELISQSAEVIQLASGASVSVLVEFKNTGNVTWRNTGEHFVALNVQDPSGRRSAFQDVSWIEYYRPAILQSAEVKAGETGTVTFELRAPNTAGSYTESFGLVAEGVAWIEGATLRLPIIVTEPEPETTPTIEPIVASANISAGAVTPDGQLPSQLLVDDANTGFVQLVMTYSNRFILGVALLLLGALLVSVVVKVRIQHYPTIFRTALVIVLAGLLYISHFHFIEAVGKIVEIF